MADVIQSDISIGYSSSGNYFGSMVGYPVTPPVNSTTFDDNVKGDRKITTIPPAVVELKYTGRFSPQEG